MSRTGYRISRNTASRPLVGLTIVAACCLIPVYAVAQPTAWTPEPMETVTAETDGDFSTEPDPIALVAPRNGVASGQVLVRNANLAGARVSDLSGPQGASIPASQARVRFAVREIDQHDWSHEYFDALLSRPPAAGAGGDDFVPVWVTVQIPHDAAPGTYRGTLSVGGLEVPVELEVADFLLADPRDWVSHAWLIQSPEAIAWTYKADLWSEDHFRRLEPSLRLLGGVGNNVVHIPVHRWLHLGNDHGMLVFRREGGRIRPDFRFVDRYLELYDEHVGPPRVVNLYLWEPRQNPAHQDTERLEVTFIDAQGRLSEGEIPIYGRGEGDAIWHEVIDGMRQRLDDLGWDRDALMLGVGHDRRPGESKVAFFNNMDPPLQWVVFSHWRGDPRSIDELVIDHGMNVGYAETPDPALHHSDFHRSRLGGGWRDGHEVIWGSSFRAVIRAGSSPTTYRGMPDVTVMDRYAGFTRIGLDGWAAPHPETGNRTNTIMRHRHGWFRLFRHNPRSIVAPGPEGAVATVRYEMLREGIQEAEARILLERALESDKLSDRTRERVEGFLESWIQDRYHRGKGRDRLSFEILPDWRERTFGLFALAGIAADEADLTATASPAPRPRPRPAADSADTGRPPPPSDSRAASDDEAAARSLVQLARNLHAAGLTESAQNRLEECMKEYPDTDGAETAAELLDEWSKADR